MSRKSAVQAENNFVLGLITQTTPLKFPPNACTEIFDCELNLDGSISRRMGFEFEDNYEATDISTFISTYAYTEYLWQTAGGQGDRSFIVLQQGPTLFLYDVSSSMNIGINIHATTIDLSDFLPSGSTLIPGDYPCQYAIGAGRLIVVNPVCQPFIVIYDPDSNTFDTDDLLLKERDFKGIEDNLAPAERPIDTLSGIPTNNPEHYYNILNQGWFTGGSNTNDGAALSQGTGDALGQWDSARSDLPSNTDTVKIYRSSATDSFDPTKVQANSPGSAIALRGHFLVDVFYPNRTLALLNDGFTATVANTFQTFQRPSTVAFFSGRAFYSGINFDELAGNIYFTQIIEHVDQFEQCYQKNDPTSEFLFDLLPDDGGVIKIPEVGTIHKLFAFRTALIVIANNGIWLVAGSSGQNFAANDYTVKRISSIGSNSPLSVVDYKGVPIWWGDDGISSITYNTNYDSFDIVSLTDTTIRSFYFDVPAINRKYVKGVYDIFSDRIYWIYNDRSNSQNYYKYNKVLSSVSSNHAFFPWTISGGPDVRGLVFVQTGDRSFQPSVKYITTSSTGIVFAEVKDTTYLDWTIFNGGVDYTSYFITGYRIDAEAMKFFQANYIMVFVSPDEDEGVLSSCFLQTIYDFTTSGNSGKWSSKQQIYYTGLADRSTDSRRLKTRGKGRALQLKFTSEISKPFNILGWAMWETANSNL